MNALRLLGLSLSAAASAFAQDLDSLPERLAPEGAPLQRELRSALETLPGRIALEKTVREHGEAGRVSRGCAVAVQAADHLLERPMSGRAVQFLLELEPYRQEIGAIHEVLYELVAAMSTEPGLQSRFRVFLASERAALLYHRHPELRSQLRAHLDWMTCRWEDEKRWVNPHAAGRLAAELDAFEAEWAALEPLLEAVGERARAAAVSTIGTELRSLPGQLFLLSRIGLDAVGGLDPASSWIEEHFRAEGERLVLREEADEEIEALLARVARRRAELEASPSPIVLDPAALAHDTEKLDLLRSSAFFNPRTMRGWEIYNEEYEDHVAARIFGVFDWVVGNSRSFEEAVAKLRKRNEWAPALGPTHEKVIVYIAAVPRWLSSSTDGEGFRGDGGWQHFKAHTPKEWEPWRELVRETVRLFEEIDEGCEMYYEVWNEPDGEYWREDTAAFLRMYEETVRAVREVDRRGLRPLPQHRAARAADSRGRGAGRQMGGGVGAGGRAVPRGTGEGRAGGVDSDRLPRGPAGAGAGAGVGADGTRGALRRLLGFAAGAEAAEVCGSRAAAGATDGGVTGAQNEICRATSVSASSLSGTSSGAPSSRHSASKSCSEKAAVGASSRVMVAVVGSNVPFPNGR